MHASSSLGASTCVADELFERVLVAFEYSWSAYTPNVLAVFSELIEHYGDTGLMLLGAVLYRSVERMDFHEEPAPEPDHAIYHGRLLVRCEALWASTGMVRRGDKETRPRS